MLCHYLPNWNFDSMQKKCVENVSTPHNSVARVNLFPKSSALHRRAWQLGWGVCDDVLCSVFTRCCALWPDILAGVVHPKDVVPEVLFRCNFVKLDCAAVFFLERRIFLLQPVQMGIVAHSSLQCCVSSLKFANICSCMAYTTALQSPKPSRHVLLERTVCTVMNI